MRRQQTTHEPWKGKHTMPQPREELALRVKAKQKELEAQLHKLAANALNLKDQEIERIKKKLDEVAELTKEGWENMIDNVAEQLNRWLRDDNGKPEK
jgi:hypothetical protein